ncbi:MAG TPA: membrane protein insertase YidC [Candidatus Eisenbacteria bacterium]|nr:membrane protein insertase YidC [Candidatus Eisenbacteria bacterium]
MDKRVLLLVVLCVIVFMGWSLLMRAIYPPAPPGPPPPAAAAPKEVPQAPADPGKIAPAPEVRQKDEAEKTTTLDNGRITAVATNKGAGIREATVTVPGQSSMALLTPFDKAIPHLAVIADSGDDTSRTGWTVTEEIPKQSVTYVFKLRNGVDIEKKLTLPPAGTELKILLTLRNTAPATPRVVNLRMVALTGLTHDSPYRYDYYGNGFVTTVSGGVHATQSVAYDAPAPRPRNADDKNPPRYFTVEIPAEEKASRQIEWIGLRNRYAAAVLISREDRTWIRKVEFRATTQARDGEGAPLKALAVEAELRESRVAEGSHIAGFSLVLAPLRHEDLASIPAGTDHLLSYGCWGALFNPIGRFILWLIGVAHGIAGNYGWAIILTTLFIRVCMFPLTRKSQVSMSRMAELQPKLALLRERYPDDKVKQQQETMKLFKENKVNPLSGCFPILMQLPVFIGLYSVLDISLVFRHEKFISWITDLSQPDRLVSFKNPIDLWITTIPDFNLVPIVMTITWFLQAYFAPKPQDPQLAAQQKMMMFMPIVFGLLCYSLASGLSLYLFVNSLLALIEQKLIKKYFLPAKAPNVDGTIS